MDATRFKINFCKSKIVRMHLGDAETQALAEILQCKVETFPHVYLGLPLSSSKLNLADLQPTIARIDIYLAGWQANFLSYAARGVLVNSVLDSLQIFVITA